MVKKFSQEINFFNFRELSTNDIYYDTFDVSNCFPRDEERVHLDLFLKTDSGEFLQSKGSPSHDLIQRKAVIAFPSSNEWSLAKSQSEAKFLSYESQGLRRLPLNT